ncbi:MAG: ThiF family adenylyltransferase [Candidatus Dojkabacteria bacterium]
METQGTFNWVQHPQLARASLMRQGSEQQMFANEVFLVIGGGTVGYRVTEALAHSGAGLGNNGKVIVYQGPDQVDIENLHSAFRLQDIGQPKPEVLQALVSSISPSAHFQIHGENVTNSLEVLEKHRPGIVIDACDDLTAKIGIRRDAATLAQQNRHKVNAIIMGTDTGYSRIVEYEDPRVEEYTIFNGKVSPDTLRLLEETESPLEQFRARVSLVFQAVGFEDFPTELLQGFITFGEKVMRREKVSYPQHPFAGIRIGADIAEIAFHLINDRKVKSRVILTNPTILFTEEGEQEELKRRRVLQKKVLELFFGKDAKYPYP